MSTNKNSEICGHTFSRCSYLIVRHHDGECIRQISESKGYELGYKFQNHKSIKYFLDEKLNLRKISLKFDRYRKLRNGINYYGDEVKFQTAKEISSEVNDIVEQIKNYID